MSNITFYAILKQQRNNFETFSNNESVTYLIFNKQNEVNTQNGNPVQQDKHTNRSLHGLKHIVLFLNFVSN